MHRPRWMFALGWMFAGAATLAAGVGGWMALRPKARTHAFGSALIRVNSPWTPLDGEAEPESERRLRFDLHRRTQAALLRSPNVLSATAVRLDREHPDLLAGKADPVKWLDDSIQVEEVGGPLLAVSTPGLPRKQQALIVNILVEEFQLNSLVWNSGFMRMRAEMTQKSLATYRQDLAWDRRALREGNLDPERQAALRDEIGVLEELSRRTAMVAERLRLERDGEDSTTLVAKAIP